MHKHIHFTQLVLRMDTADLVSVYRLIKTQFPHIVLAIGYGSMTAWVRNEDVHAIQHLIEKDFRIRLEVSRGHEVKWAVGLYSFGPTNDHLTAY